MYCTAPLSPSEGHLTSFHDDDDDETKINIYCLKYGGVDEREVIWGGPVHRVDNSLVQ